jgi:uncharacterized protein (DUF2345 family)
VTRSAQVRRYQNGSTHDHGSNQGVIMNRRTFASIAAACVCSSLVVGEIAWAAIPTSDGVVTACYGKVTGIVRVIDPANGQRCLTGRELPLSWNQTGPQGAQGASPTVTPLDRGDANCPTGGAAITDARGSVAYVSSGADGESFDGTFTSPNGQSSIAVSDGGIVLTDTGGASVTLAGGAVTVVAAADTSITSGRSLAVTSGLDTIVTSGRDSSTTTGRNASTATVGATRVEVAGPMTLTAGSSLDVRVGDDTTIATQGSTNIRSGVDVVSTAGRNMSTSTGGAMSVDIGTSLTVDAASTVDVQAGSTLVIAATGDLTVQTSADLRLRGSRILPN